MGRLEELEKKIHEDEVKVWHHLHQNPELSMKEYETADYIEKLLRETTSVDRIERIGETGIWAELVGTAANAGDEEKILILRGDMDALPIEEKNDLSYRSQKPGVMHACGHDVHTTALLGAVRVLEQYRDQIPGRIWFFFQPGEEVMGGAKEFVADPRIDFSKATGAFGVHVAGNLEVGKIRLKKGPVLASSDELHFVIKGVGGHAAYPKNTRDAIVAAGYLIVQLQTLVSREINGTDSAVLSLGRIVGGTKDNIIADTVEIAGTLRTLNKDIREQLWQSIRRVCDGIELSLRVKIDFDIKKGALPLINDSTYVDIAERAGAKLFGSEKIAWSEEPGMAGEDFSYFTDLVPGAFVFIGAQTPGRAAAAGHTPGFYTDEGALRTGTLILSGAALEFFGVEF